MHIDEFNEAMVGASLPAQTYHCLACRRSCKLGGGDGVGVSSMAAADGKARVAAATGVTQSRRCRRHHRPSRHGPRHSSSLSTLVPLSSHG